MRFGGCKQSDNNNYGSFLLVPGEGIKNMFLYVCMYVCVRSSSIYCRAPSIPEAHDLSRSSSNASSFASVVEENETEATEDYDTGMVRTAHLSSTHSSNEHL